MSSQAQGDAIWPIVQYSWYVFTLENALSAFL